MDLYWLIHITNFENKSARIAGTESHRKTMAASYELPVMINMLERSRFQHIRSGKLQDVPCSFVVSIYLLV